MAKVLFFLALIVFVSGCTFSPQDLLGETPSTKEKTTLQACLEGDDLLKDDCIFNLVKSGQSTELCENVSNEQIAGKCFAFSFQGIPTINQCKKSSLSNVADYCYKEIAIISDDAQICANISSTTINSSCVNLFLQSEKTIKSCQLLPTDSEKTVCLKSLAKQIKSHEPCERIDDVSEKNSCFNEIDKKDSFYCSFITGLEQKDLCYSEKAVFSKNIELCKKVGLNETKDNCFYDVGIASLKADYCELISDVSLENDCREEVSDKKKGFEKCFVLGDKDDKFECYKDLSVDTFNEKYCSYISAITHSDLKNSCYNETASVKNDFELCSNIKNDSNALNSCISNVAINLQDESICSSKVKIIENKDLCFKGVAESLLNDRICFNINDDNSQSQCVKSIALDLNNESVCSGAILGSVEDNCFHNIAVQKSDSDLCNQITSSIKKRDKCFKNFAFKKLDTRICDKISFPETEGQCYEQIGFELGNINICTEIEVGPLNEPETFESRDSCYKFLADDTGDKGHCVSISTEAIQADCNALFT